MIPANVVHIETPKGVSLHGLWFGPKKPRRVFVLIHGLTSSAFSISRVLPLVDAKTAVLSFNNRGHGIVNDVKSKKKQTKPVLGGSAHELFSDCVDDIDGALRFCKKQKAGEVYLIGHSTGCQKAIFWASKRKGGSGVKGIVLLAPISDYASHLWMLGEKKLARGVEHAWRLVKMGRVHDFMPAIYAGPFPCDAQRFLSLYTPESIEEVFSYAHARTPEALHAVKVPVHLVLAEKDEFSDRPAKDIAAWFVEHTKTLKVSVIRGANHFFKKKEEGIAREVRRFVEEVRRK